MLRHVRAIRFELGEVRLGLSALQLSRSPGPSAAYRAQPLACPRARANRCPGFIAKFKYADSNIGKGSHYAERNPSSPSGNSPSRGEKAISQRLGEPLVASLAGSIRWGKAEGIGERSRACPATTPCVQCPTMYGRQYGPIAFSCASSFP